MNKNEKDLLDLARKHFKQGKYKSTEPLLNQIILKQKKNPEVFHMLGTIYHDQGKFNKAINAFRRSIALDPFFIDASIGLSIILNDLGQYEKAKDVFEKAQQALKKASQAPNLHIKNKMAQKHQEMGELYLQHGWNKEAVEQFEKSLSLSNKHNLQTYLFLAQALMNMSQFEKTTQILKTYLNYDSKNTKAHIVLGKCYYKQNRVAEAVEQWELVLRLAPHNKEAKIYLNKASKARVTNFNETRI